MERIVILGRRFWSVILILGLLLSLFPIPASAMTENEAVEWAKAQVGSMIGNGQCTRLVEAYAWQFFGVNFYSVPKEYPAAELPDGWQKIQYYPGFIPSPGDIAIWEPGRGSWGWINELGHTAIVISATESEIVSVDQNWTASGDGSAAQIITHRYNSFWGVLRPPFNGKPGHQIDSPTVDAVGSSAAINRNEPADIPLRFSGVGPWTLVYLDGGVENTRVFNTREAVLTVYPSRTTVFTLISVTDSSYYNICIDLNIEIKVEVLQNFNDASEWAIPELQEAFDVNLIPYPISTYSWVYAISRLAAAEAITQLIEKATGKSVGQIAAENGWDLSVNGFSDTDNQSVTFLKYAGITLGISSDEYYPMGNYSRAMMMTMFGRVAEKFFGYSMTSGGHPFTDVPDWAEQYVAYAVENGITRGISEDRFGADNVLTNEQTVAFCLRALKAWR